MSKFNTLWEEVYAANKEATKNKKKKNVPHSKAKQAILTQALLNDYEYQETIMKSSDGEYVEETITPVSDFRTQFIRKVLTDNGVDKQQAEDAAKNYEFTKAQAEAFDAMAREDLDQYLRAGFTYKFADKKDFSGSLRITDVDEKTVTSRVPGSDKTVTTNTKAHKELVKKSNAPKWLRTKIK